MRESAGGLTAETPEDEMPTCPNCGPAARMFGQYYRNPDGTDYDLFTCHECGDDFTVEEIDAASAYAQARIDGDPVAERVRLAARAQRERQRRRRADLRRLWRKASRAYEVLDEASWRPALAQLTQLRKATQPLQSWAGGPMEYRRIGARVEALNRAADLRRRRPFGRWQEHHRTALETVRIWRSIAGDYRGLPQ